MLRAASWLCLDAPLIALAWEALFARVFAIEVSLASRAALFLTTWAIYVFDRLADAASLRPGVSMSGRQRFARRHAGGGRALLALLIALDGVVIAHLSARLLVVGVAVGVLCVGYLAVNRTSDRTWQRWPVKEICVGSLFALGTLAALLPNGAVGFMPSAVLLALVCVTNAVAIAAWERELDAVQGKSSLGTRWGAIDTALPAIAFAVAGLALAGIAIHVPPAIALTAALSAATLGTLHLVRHAIAADDRTALADLALVVPVIPALLRVLA